LKRPFLSAFAEYSTTLNSTSFPGDVRVGSKNGQIRRGDPQLFRISSLAMESTPLGMVKSSVSGQLFFCDFGH